MESTEEHCPHDQPERASLDGLPALISVPIGG